MKKAGVTSYKEFAMLRANINSRETYGKKCVVNKIFINQSLDCKNFTRCMFRVLVRNETSCHMLWMPLNYDCLLCRLSMTLPSNVNSLCLIIYARWVSLSYFLHRIFFLSVQFVPVIFFEFIASNLLFFMFVYDLHTYSTNTLQMYFLVKIFLVLIFMF